MISAFYPGRLLKHELVVISFLVVAFAAVAVAFHAPGAFAQQEKLTCPTVARAYASEEISEARALEYLKLCVEARLRNAGTEWESAPKPESEAIIPETCHDKAGLLAINPQALTVDDLAYLHACIDRDIKIWRERE